MLLAILSLPSAGQESGHVLQLWGRSLSVFLELRQERGLLSEGTAQENDQKPEARTRCSQQEETHRNQSIILSTLLLMLFKMVARLFCSFLAEYFK